MRSWPAPGVTYVSKFAITTEVANGTLSLVRLADFRIERDFVYAHLRRRVLSRAVGAFLAYLEEQAALSPDARRAARGG